MNFLDIILILINATLLIVFGRSIYQDIYIIRWEAQKRKTFSEAQKSIHKDDFDRYS